MNYFSSLHSPMPLRAAPSLCAAHSLRAGNPLRAAHPHCVASPSPAPTADPSSKYLVLPSGELHIANVSAEDGNKSFRCRTQHRLTGDTKLSATAGRLVISSQWLEPVCVVQWSDVLCGVIWFYVILHRMGLCAQVHVKCRSL